MKQKIEKIWTPLTRAFLATLAAVFGTIVVHSNLKDIIAPWWAALAFLAGGIVVLFFANRLLVLWLDRD